MKINSLELNNFRNYTFSKSTFNDGLNFIVGSNAQGKTNMLESIYLLSVGKSPKNSKDKQIIRFNQNELILKLYRLKLQELFQRP